MIQKVSVLIVDDNIEFGNLLEKYLNREIDFEVAGVARDGMQALEMISALSPDVVILDLIMPNLDGIGVLEKLRVTGNESGPLFIMLSAIGQDIFVKKAITLGAEYYLVKPFDASVLVTRMRQLVKERQTALIRRRNLFEQKKTDHRPYEETGLEYRVTGLMHDIGMPPHLTGYHYIREAVIYSVNNSRSNHPVTKVIYPEVARKFGTSSQKVERAIRSAIESAWNKNSKAMLLELGIKQTNRVRKPTNSEFLAVMADKIRISLGNN